MRARAISYNETPFADRSAGALPDLWPLVRGAGLAVGGLTGTGAAIATVTTLAAWIVTTGLSHSPNAPYAQAKPGLRALALVESVPMLLGPASMQAPQFAALPEAEPIQQAIVVSEPAKPAPIAAPPVAEINPPLPQPRVVAEVIPIPQPRPVIHELAQAPKVEPAPIKLADAALVPVPLSEQKDKGLQGLKKQAALPPVTKPEPVLPAETRVALYDISRHTVYLPGGRQLEAHSGIGERMDDPSFIRVKMRGPTPPNEYKLTLRESLFHGVRAIRLNPVDYGRMYGRDGMLAHTYMLGPSGQSNGCVSFKNYNAFLQAYLNGEINRLVVVPRIEEAPPSLVRAVGAKGSRVAAAGQGSTFPGY